LQKLRRPTFDTEQIIGAAIEVHRILGPGMLESAYEACLAFELRQRSIRFERQKPVGLTYKTQNLDCGYRIDLIVEELVIVEVKSVERLNRVHAAQLLSYLRLMDCRLGLLINFNEEVLRAGLRRVVNGFPD